MTTKEKAKIDKEAEKIFSEFAIRKDWVMKRIKKMHEYCKRNSTNGFFQALEMIFSILIINMQLMYLDTEGVSFKNLLEAMFKATEESQKKIRENILAKKKEAEDNKILEENDDSASRS